MKTLLASKRFQLGFTLVELLIVVAIIAILVSVGAASYTTAQRNARDAQRKSDLRSVQLALEQFHTDYGSYPDEKWLADDDLDSISCQILDNADSSKPPIDAQQPFSCNGVTYLSRLPADPNWNNRVYFYEVHEDPDFPSAPGSPGWCDEPTNTVGTGSGHHGHCQKYTLWTRLENVNDPDIIASNNDSQCQLARNIEAGLSNNNYNYCVHQP